MNQNDTCRIWEKIVKDASDPITGQWKKPATIKRCNICDKVKPLNEFYTKTISCKQCVIKTRVAQKKLRKLKEKT